MITITTTEKAVKIQTANFTWDIAKGRVKGQIPFTGGTTIVTEMGQVAIPFDGVIADGQTFTSAEEIQEWVQTNCFKAGGTGPSDGVQWDDVEGKPAVIAAGDTQAAARSALGLGSAATHASSAFATAEQGAKADSAVQPEALVSMLKSQQEEGKGLPVTNYLPITQEDFDALTVKNPTTTYDIIEQYPTA